MKQNLICFTQFRHYLQIFAVNYQKMQKLSSQNFYSLTSQKSENFQYWSRTSWKMKFLALNCSKFIIFASFLVSSVKSFSLFNRKYSTIFNLNSSDRLLQNRQSWNKIQLESSERICNTWQLTQGQNFHKLHSVFNHQQISG